MFLREKSTLISFKGYRVVAFRQGRSNLAERMLTRSVIHFAPHVALVGVFLASPMDIVSHDLLEVAWKRQGCPCAKSQPKGTPFLFGKPLTYEVVPYVGYDDLWEDEGKVIVAFKRNVIADDLISRLTVITHQRLIERAHALMEKLIVRGAQRPKKILLKALRRSLGQCSRDGVVVLNPELLMWHEAILEETLAHELTHLKHFNHSPDFWRELTRLLPDWLPRTLVHYLTPYVKG